MYSIEWFNMIRKGGNIIRFHCSKMNTPQDVAQHSFNAALMAEELAHHIDGVDPHTVVMHMLLHDIPEQHIGDSPGFAKSKYPKLKKALDDIEEKWVEDTFIQRHQDAFLKLNSAEARLCRFVDLIECALKGLEEHAYGGKDGAAIFYNCFNSAKKVKGNHDINAKEEALYERILLDIGFEARENYGLEAYEHWAINSESRLMAK